MKQEIWCDRWIVKFRGKNFRTKLLALAHGFIFKHVVSFYPDQMPQPGRALCLQPCTAILLATAMTRPYSWMNILYHILYTSIRCLNRRRKCTCCPWCQVLAPLLSYVRFSYSCFVAWWSARACLDSCWLTQSDLWTSVHPALIQYYSRKMM